MKKFFGVCLILAAAMAWAGCGTDGGGQDNGVADVHEGDTSLPDVAGEDVTDDARDEDVRTPDDGEPTDVVLPPDSDDVSTDTTVVSNAVNYLVIASDSLIDSANELAAYRESTGYRTQVVTRSDVLGSEFASTSGWENMARGRIRQAWNELDGAGTLFVVLVGDSEKVDAEGFTKPLPVSQCENVLTDICYTDNRIADMDNDNVPDVAIGRITASNNEEVRSYIQKLQAHESSYVPGLWNRRVSLYIGEAGFSPEIDSLLETFTFMGLDRVSHAFDIIGAYDNEDSDYFYTPFHDKVVELINAGSLMTVYIGHGNAQWTQGLEYGQIDEIDCQNRLPIMVLLACLNGDFANPMKETLSEGLLHHPDGPIVVFASSDESHPVGNAVLAYELTRVGLAGRPATVGELFMQLKDASINHTDEFREMIDQASIAYGEEGCDDPALLYWQHNDLYNLLGDPAAPVKYPHGVVQDIQVDGTMAARSLTVSGAVPGIQSGTAYVSIEVKRDEYVGSLTPRPEEGDPSWESTVQSNWEIMNNKTFAASTVDVTDGVFTANLTWETNVGGGDRYIKVYAWDGTDPGDGTTDAIAEYRITK
ncbi:MAG TPA: C25 family cysteine peptidase [Myxococcota bacterium]|nr:C25 family cysteine peptidase [Myxococcota bacterium]